MQDQKTTDQKTKGLFRSLSPLVAWSLGLFRRAERGRNFAQVCDPMAAKPLRYEALRPAPTPVSGLRFPVSKKPGGTP